MKIFNMIRAFPLKWDRSSKIVQNVMFHVKLCIVPTSLKMLHHFVCLSPCLFHIVNISMRLIYLFFLASFYVAKRNLLGSGQIFSV